MTAAGDLRGQIVRELRLVLLPRVAEEMADRIVKIIEAAR